MSKRDEELMREFAAGDPCAFDALLERYRRPAFGFIVSMLRDRAAAEDVFQEVFMKIISAAPAFDPERRFAPWLYKIVDNCCMDALRDPARRLQAAGASTGDTATAAPAENPERALLLKERRDALARAITLLPERQRSAIALHEFAGLSYKAIADATNRPLNSVLSDSHRALKSLRKHLSPKP